jgi:hypothetical protein
MPFEVLDLSLVFLRGVLVLKVPRFFRLPVLGSIFLEYSLYSPDFSFLIIFSSFR